MEKRKSFIIKIILPKLGEETIHIFPVLKDGYKLEFESPDRI